MTTRNLTQKMLTEGESIRVAFVKSVHDLEAIGRHVAAMLNTRGGSVLVGTETLDPGICPRDAQAIREYLHKEITPQIIYSVSIDSVEAGKVLVVDVPQGEDRPYVFQGTVYTRERTDSLIADAETMRLMVENRARRPERWERRASSGLGIGDLDVDLIGKVVQRAQEKRGYRFASPDDPETVLKELGLTRFGQFTNAADVLFGRQVAIRHPQTRVRAVCYESDKGNRFIDEQLFEGPLLTLFGMVMAFFQRHVSISSDFESGSLTRVTRAQYPWNSLREGLVNAFAHRDYASFSGGVTASVYPDRIEILNSGRLPKGISAESLRRETHDSILVNPDISHVFYLYELMERVGRGTFKIVQECREYGMRLPEWKSGASGVRLTFFAAERNGRQSLELNERQENLLHHLNPGDKITRQEYAERFAMGVTDRTARRDLSMLEDYRLLIRHGSGPKTIYERTEVEP
jgi:ATP-dependent DNA helicase RecG